MTPERWGRIGEVFGAALEVSADERYAFLDQACDGDEQLRLDVDRLLAEERNPSFPSPVAALADAALAPGQMLGRYRVEEKLGEGGMGAVYRAYDTLLRRPVALKVLRASLLADAESRRRLVQEARAASALSHPNIVTIHDIGCESGVDLIAMEYLPGKTLDGLIGSKGLGLPETLRYAVQIADALAAAHAAGIVHRDVKPGNILVTDAGMVKVLDFGLAKAVTSHSGATTALTAQGTVMGTASYMSPEQAEGKPVDARSDIFSFGAVLYEMITGRRAFPGDPQHAPPPLDGVIARCLRRDPARRFQHMDEVKAALEDIEQQPATRAPRRKLLLAAIAVLAIVASAIGWQLIRFAPDKPLLLTQITRESGLTYQPAISPDGNLIAYASDRSGEDKLDIWLQHVPQGEPMRLTRDRANNSEPSFSLDGGTIVFTSNREGFGQRGGAIYVVPTLGGEERKIADAGRRPRFSPDGQWIAYWAGDIHSAGAMYVVPAAGGTPRQVPPVGAAPFDRSPVWTPDGKHLLYFGARQTGADWRVVSAEGGTPVATGVLGELRRANLQATGTLRDYIWPDAWIPGADEVLFSARTGDSINLWKIPISPRNWRVQGPPQRVTFGPGPELEASVSTGGRIVFSNPLRNLHIWSLPVDANRGTVRGPLQQLTRGGADERSPTVSRDGKRMVFESDRTGERMVWTKDLETGSERMLTSSPVVANRARLSPDGTKVAYSLPPEGRAAGGRLFIVPFTGGTPRRIPDGGNAAGWTTDGQGLLYQARSPAPLQLLDLRTGKNTVAVDHPRFKIVSGALAPDGDWVLFGAFAPDQSGGDFIARLRDGVAAPESEWIPTRAWSWSPDGNLMWSCLGLDGYLCIWTQRLDPQTKRMVGEPQAVYHSHSARRSLGNVGNGIGLSVAADKVVFTMGELTGNIWMAERETR